MIISSKKKAEDSNYLFTRIIIAQGSQREGMKYNHHQKRSKGRRRRDPQDASTLWFSVQSLISVCPALQGKIHSFVRDGRYFIPFSVYTASKYKDPSVEYRDVNEAIVAIRQNGSHFYTNDDTIICLKSICSIRSTIVNNDKTLIPHGEFEEEATPCFTAIE
jgi:hypothetical protein